MVRMDKKEISRILEEIGELLEIKGENLFKIKAYYNASKTVEAMEKDISTAIADGTLMKQKGIGKAIYDKVIELYNTGHLEYYEELKREIPETLLELVKIPGVGPKKARRLYDLLGITTVGELEYACLENRLVELQGFGKTTQEKILKGIEFYKKGMGLHLLSAAMAEADRLVASLKDRKGIIRLDIAGSIRRRKEVIKDIDLVASVTPGMEKKVMDAFTGLQEAQSVIARGDTKATILLKTGINADMRVVSDKEFPFALIHFTGSAEHNAAMRGRAKRLGIKMNEYGIFKGEKIIPCKDEEEIYRALGLSYIPPELRENTGEIEAAEKGTLPELVELSDIRGLFHVHTTYSDGSMTLREMVRVAREMGYEYIGICDHSKSAYYAGGLTEDRVKKQHEEIDRLNSEVKDFRIYKGIEVDILADGSLDYSDEVLESFDLVIVSIHSKFNMTREEMTGRIIRAISHPSTTILAHPTGRLLLSREGYDLDLHRIIEKAGELGVVIELNSHPYRLDLDWRYLQYAKECGVKISINPDAHHLEDLQNVIYGVAIARKGWLTREDILNTLSCQEIEDFLADIAQ